MALSGMAGDPSSVQADDPTAFSARTRLLVIAPHPDDETIATGLLIQQVQAAGGEVGILLLTAGDNNPWPQRWLERRLWIGRAARQRWGRRRQGEMQQALQHLGVAGQSLQLLGWPDMGVTDVLLRSDHSAITVLATAIDRFKPNLVALPGIADRHPDHGSAHVLVRLVLARRVDPPRLWAYLVHGHGGRGRQLEVSGSTGQQANKSAALAAHCSQMALSGGRMRRLAARPERYEVITPTIPAGTSTALPWRPPAWLRPWLRLSVIDSTGVKTWRWRDAPLRQEPDGHFQLLPEQGAGGARFVRLASVLPALWIFDRWGWHELP